MYYLYCINRNEFLKILAWSDKFVDSMVAWSFKLRTFQVHVFSDTGYVD